MYGTDGHDYSNERMHTTIRVIWVTVAVLLILFGIYLLIQHSISSNHDTARACIDSGRIWVNQSCIPASK